MAEQENLPVQDTNQIVEERRAKLREMRIKGNAFPNDFQREHQAVDLQLQYAETVQGRTGSQAGARRVAGRMMLKRVMGKASFATIQDMGGRIQLYISQRGRGRSRRTKRSSIWTWATSWAPRHAVPHQDRRAVRPRQRHLRLLTKALRPLPEKFHGLTDHGTAIPPALSGPDHQRARRARSSSSASHIIQCHPRLLRRAAAFWKSKRR